MYPVGGWIGLLRGRQESRWTAVRSAVPGNVFFLGLTSLLTDISAEMVVAALPVYLVGFLRLSPAQFGVVDGLYQGVGGLVQLIAAHFTDRFRRYKEVAAFGYVTSAVTKVGLLMTAQWPAISALLTVDRLGKGMRTAPRDALISLSVDRASLATAFGAHRAMDACGAMVGPILTFAILSAFHDGFDLVFVVSLAAAVLGVAVLLCFVENKRDAGAGLAGLSSTVPLSPRAFFANRPFRRLAIAAMLLSSMTIGDAFFYLVVQQHTALSFGVFPLLYVGTSASFLVLALPAGRLADRWGRLGTFFAGHVVLLALYGFLLITSFGPWATIAVVAMLGLYYATTEGVLQALGSSIVPAGHRATGLAMLATVTALARFFSSVAFGLAWSRLGLETALTGFGIGLAIAVAVSVFVLQRGIAVEETP